MPETLLPPDPDTNKDLRMFIALRILRAWNNGTAGFDSRVVRVINHWVDQGMQGAIPWPDSRFFAEWAEEWGLSNVGGFIGFRLTVRMEKLPPGKSGYGYPSLDIFRSGTGIAINVPCGSGEAVAPLTRASSLRLARDICRLLEPVTAEDLLGLLGMPAVGRYSAPPDATEPAAQPDPAPPEATP